MGIRFTRDDARGYQLTTIQAPGYPIIYVRGYAMTESEIRDTVSTPYMGFELGSTKTRQASDGSVRRFFFESPLVRLMKDFGYVDVYRDGIERESEVAPKSIVIYRYYEQADPDIGKGQVPSVIDAAEGLSKLILELRTKICGTDQAASDRFKVYLVAHSMGGLVCRSFLQNSHVGTPEAKRLVDKFFTYATPHNGIEMAGFNVPSFMSLNDLNNFNRSNMAKYLDVAESEVNTLKGSPLPPDRTFCLVGTNSKDYAVALGLSRALAGEASDGLVRVTNAYVAEAPRAYVNRSHSGYFGIVNSEEGYQNLTRFLFGNVRTDGTLQVIKLPLPPELEKQRSAGKRIDAAYYFESVVAPRGAFTFELTRRTKDSFSAILRRYADLFGKHDEPLDDARDPYLFSVFLDTRNIEAGRSLVFSVDIAVSTTGYEVDGSWLSKVHIPGENLFRDNLVLFATPAKDVGGWNVTYAWSDDQWSGRGRKTAVDDEQGYAIPLKNTKGFEATLRLKVRGWA